MAAHLIVEDTEPFLRITINRPGRGNVVTPRMMLELPEAIASGGPRHKAVVLRGVGPDFCLGREPKPIPGGRTDTAFTAHAAVMAPMWFCRRPIVTGPWAGSISMTGPIQSTVPSYGG